MSESELPSIRLRVGSLIATDGRTLLSSNETTSTLYSVGGGVQVGETAEDALRRELLEETGCALELGPLAVIHEDFFKSDADGRPEHEVGLYFWVDVPPLFEPSGTPRSRHGGPESVSWVELRSLTPEDVHPAWLLRVLTEPHQGVLHLVSERDRD